MTAETPTRIHDFITANLERFPDAPAYKDCDGTVYDWADFAALVDEAAILLIENGAAHGERVMVVAENCIAVPVMLMAASRTGAWAVPVNARMSEGEIARISRHANPAAIVYTSQVSGDAASHADGVKAEGLITGFGGLHIARGASDPEAVDASPDTPAIVLYTTGTTGDPKGVMLTHSNLFFTARSSSEMRGLVHDDHVCGVLPLTHVFGIASMLMASAWAGAMVELITRFDPATLLPKLKHDITAFPAVPQMHAMLMSCAAEQGMDTLGHTKLRYVSSGAAPLDPAWKRKAEAFYGLPLQNGYGMTETTAGIAATTATQMGDPDISVGTAVPGGCEYKLDSDVGADSETGEVLVRGGNVMKGYFRNPEATAETFTADGWLRTGDLGRIDDKGRLHIVGRTKELIIRGGFNVYPVEVESVLNDHEAVLQAAVIGRRVDGDEEVLAFIQLHSKGSVGVDELRAFAAGKLAGYKCPRHILLVDDLPAAATGKILKHKLAEHFERELEALG